MHMLKQNDIDHVLHPYTNLSRHRDVGPMVIERGEGVYVYDTEGNRYIEALSGLFCASLGFSEQRLADAADRQMRKLPFYHAFGHKSSEPSILLAEKLIAMAPVPMSKVFFANSGSEANDTAVKLIWYYNNALGRPLKKKIIARTRAYHGVTIASASLTGLPNNHRDFDLPIDRILHTDCPHYYRHALPGESEEQFATRCADSLEQLILREGPETIAAFFAEPVMASGGVIVPPATYMEKIQRVLKRYDILLVADEVICGFGRTGNMFGSETFGMQPDMIVVAKQLSAGYLPISALMVNEGIYRALVAESEKIGTFGHGFTYSGHPVCAAVALETLRIYDEDGVLDHVRDVIPHFQQRVPISPRIRSWARHAGPGCSRPSSWSPTRRRKRRSRPAEGVAIHAGERALTYGVITRALGDTFNFCPPLIITHDEIDQLFDASKQALDDTLAWRRSLAAR